MQSCTEARFSIFWLYLCESPATHRFIWSATLLHIHPASRSYTWEVPSITTAVYCWLHWSRWGLKAVLKGTLSPVVAERWIGLTHSFSLLYFHSLARGFKQTSSNNFFGIAVLLDSYKKDTRSNFCALTSPSVPPRWSHRGWCVYPHELDGHVPAMTRQ